jgi:protocatechuate 3,4-dioxygenase beta subunit
MSKYIKLAALLIILIGLFIWGLSRIPQARLQQDQYGQQSHKITDIFKKEPSPYSLKAGSTLTRIVDQQGNGVAGALITLKAKLKKDCDGNLKEDPPTWHGTSIETNDNGEFTITQETWDWFGENRPDLNIDISADGFLTRDHIGMGVNYSSDNDGQIDIFRASKISGVLISPDGEPVARAPLKLETSTQYKNPNSSCGGCYGGSVTTNEDGVFVFENVAPGNHTIRFPGNLGGGCNGEPKKVVPFAEYAAWETVDIQDGVDKEDVFIDLRQGYATITGKVVDKANMPMAGIQAHATKIITRYTKHGSSTRSVHVKTAVTDANGLYTMTNIPPSDYQLSATYPYVKGKNYRSGDKINIIIAGKQELNFNLVLERQDGSKPKRNSSERNLFELPIPEGLAENEFMIVDQHGKGIESATVRFSSKITIEDTKTHKRTNQNWTGKAVVTGKDGIFALPEELAPIEGKQVQCTTIIKAKGFEDRDLWYIRRSHYNKDPRIDLLPLAKVSGQVIGLDGKPAEGVMIRDEKMVAYRNPDNANSGHWTRTIRTNENGKFELTDITEGKHVIRYLPQDKADTGMYNPGIILQTQGGRNVESIVIDMRKDTCSISGKVIGRDGKPVKKARVRLSKTISHGHRGTITTYPTFYTSEETNRKGEYLLDAVAPGVYEIEATVEKDHQRKSKKMTIAIGNGQAIKYDLRLQR